MAEPAALSLEPAEKNFKDKTGQEKVKWLQTHALAAFPDVPIIEYWERGRSLNGWVNLISKLLTLITNSLKKRAGNIVKVFAKVVHAFNVGLWRFSDIVTDDINALADTGVFPEDTPLTELPRVKKVEKVADLSNESTVSDTTIMQYFDTAVDFLKQGLGVVPGLKKFNPRLNASISTVVEAFVSAGKDFATEWDKPDPAPPHDGSTPAVMFAEVQQLDGLGPVQDVTSGDEKKIVVIPPIKEVAPARLLDD
ncbi:hypothetical protein CH35J_003335 [Colletotrichum higginsianum]|uniref:Uncharacterized protein n=1 Tax=Colletotrichum higginsianum TaxID=80884 RepID=A0A4T0W9T3_9PEZI|nr:hypothetical protein CH35J_003335 [Colletotrichum higginsianum]